MKDRIKLVRKHFGMTQSEFGEKIGIKGNTVTNYENGLRNPSDAVLHSICREFNVSEDWLRTGKGDVFQKLDREAEIAQLAASLFKDEEDSFRTRLIFALANLNTDELKTLEKIALEIVEIKKD